MTNDRKHRQLEDNEKKKLRIIEKSNGMRVSMYTFGQNGLKVRMKTMFGVATTAMVVKACSVDCRAECTDVAKAPLGEQLPN